jgi:pilus assembly protein CpaF
VDRSFEDEASLEAAVHNIAQFVGRPINKNHPILDARLPDGSRVHIIIPPVSRQGVLVTIRKFHREPLTPKQLIEMGTLSETAVELLRVAMLARRNVIIAGGTGTGKTSLLNSIATMIPADERIIVIEDSSELKLVQPHTLSLETQMGDEGGRGRVTITDLFRAVLRMRPDRIIIGEVRGEEALDMLQAMISGHSGSLSTTHAESPEDCLRRIETLALYRGLELPQSAIRAQVASAIHLIVIIQRLSDGSRRVTRLTEVLGLDTNEAYRTQDILRWKSSGVNAQGRLMGELLYTGAAPAFFDYAKHLHIAIRGELFAKPSAALSP